MKHIITLAALTLSSLTAPVHAENSDWTVGPFDMPESAILDSAHNRIVLSVMGGNPAQADGNGGLALLTTNGDVLNADWVVGLDAPKGMAIVGSTLLVADLTRLHEIDLKSGTVLRSLEVPGAVFLNDIASDGDRAFVSDLMDNRIWLYEGGVMTSWLNDAALHHPNGLYVDGERLLVGSWGEGLRDDFTTEVAGSLLAVDLADQKISVVAKEVGNLDGIAKLGTDILVNDWLTGQLFAITSNGDAQLVQGFAPGLADIASYGDQLLLPSMLEGTLSTQTYP